MKNIVLKEVLKNALAYEGKTNAKAILGSLIKTNPELRKDVPALLKLIETVVKEVESLSLDKIKAKIKAEFPELLEVKKEEAVLGPLKPLPEAKMGQVITRIAPSPSGPLHIGHAYGLALNYEYAKMYKGKLILRIEDTNPENIYPPAYDLIQEDANWLTDNGVSEVIVQSSRLGMYYDYAEKLLQMSKAYVCTCPAEEWTEKKNKAIECPCRTLDKTENLLRYAKLFNEYAEGEAIVRLKTDLQDKNPAMRDFGLMRIVEHVHPKTGKEQRVWPLMVFSVAIDDHETKVSHVLNGKDHTDNAAKERIIMGYFGWKPPIYKHWGRINFEGFELSTSKTRRAIEENKYHGWDDIRLPFMQALKKRGYQPAALRKFAMEIGLSLNDKTVSQEEFWKNINAFNKDILDSKSKRYFFVEEPHLIEIKNAPAKNVEIACHPEFPELGKRKISATNKFYITKKDAQQLDEKHLHRLMDYGNFRLKGKNFHYESETYEEYKNAHDKGQIIHWLPEENNIEVEVLLDTDVKSLGLGEKSLKDCKEGEIIQLERRFFARIDKKEKDIIRCLFLHR
ncbi:glutamate--tRNA ligase [Candidatus Woesearchaeota archaeon]|nr:glutamate--tRNA ligase [Candidatus Woesearchaeota archaeon]